MTQKELLESVLKELTSIKTGMPNGELKHLMHAVAELKEAQEDVKEDISEIKYTLLNPEDGVIVKVNKNTEYRLSKQAKIEYYDKIIGDFEKMKEWKEGVTKALWIIFTALVGILINTFYQLQNAM